MGHTPGSWKESITKHFVLQEKRNKVHTFEIKVEIKSLLLVQIKSHFTVKAVLSNYTSAVFYFVTRHSEWIFYRVTGMLFLLAQIFQQKTSEYSFMPGMYFLATNIKDAEVGEGRGDNCKKMLSVNILPRAKQIQYNLF